MRYLKPYLFLVLLGVVVLFGQAAADLNLPNLMSDIVNQGMLQGDMPVIYRTGVKMLVMAFAGAVCSIVASFFAARLALGFGRDVRSAVFSKVEAYSLYEYEKIGAASLITRTTNDITQIQTVLVMGFRFILYSPIMCVGGIVMSLSKDKHLAMILLVSLPTLLVIMVGLASMVVPAFTTMQKKIDQLNLTLRESLTGIRVIRAFNRMDHEKERFTQANRDLTNVAIRVNKMMASLMPIMTLIMNGTTVAIIWFGGLRVSRMQMQIGDMMAFSQYAMQIMFSVLMVAVMFVMIPRAQASAVRVNEVLDMKTEVADPAEPQTPPQQSALVEFRGVSFAYPGAERPVLREISFVSAAGETTAIIGGTGSGKSTLAGLIPRFYDATEGEVLVDGVNVKDMAQKSLRAKIGFVPQGAILFSGTVNKNIRFGKKDASEEEIERAARTAQAYDFVSQMPDGFETEIAQGGTNLSGGQKQRLSIARAIVRNPEIYIFDDSFSALDFKTDAALRAALKKEIENATVIIVAQRISSIMDADRILVLDEGRLVGAGTHLELLQTCEVYREICVSQLSEEELA
jgi:ATP-binding cassette subfamily B protein